MIKIIQLIKSFIILLIGVIFLIVTFPLGLIAWIFSDKDKYAHPSKFGVIVLQFLAKFFCKISGCRYHIEGQENIPKDPAVYVGNHQGDYDAFLILFALGEPKIIMAKKEVKVVPIANIWMMVIKCIFVDRKNKVKARESMMSSIDYVKHGRSVLYFAEGTRSQGPQLGPFKGGAFKTAVTTGTQIVPFVIEGSYKVYEENRYLKTSDVYFHILPSVPVSTEDDPREVSDKVRNLIQDELTRIREKDQ